MHMLLIQTPLLCQNKQTNCASQEVYENEANASELSSSGDTNLPTPFTRNVAGPPVIQALRLEDSDFATASMLVLILDT